MRLEWEGGEREESGGGMAKGGDATQTATRKTKRKQRSESNLADPSSSNTKQRQSQSPHSIASTCVTLG